MKKIFLMLTAALVVTFSAMASNKPGAESGVAVVNNGTTLKLYYKGLAEANVKVWILNENGDIVFSEMLKKTDGFVRPYNIASIPAGEYTIEVSDHTTNYSAKVIIGKEHKRELANLFRVRGEDGKYLLTVPTQEAKDINVRILADDAVIYDEVVAISSNFARIYNLKKIKGALTFEIKDGKGNTTVVSY
jgi:hypothetical protein